MLDPFDLFFALTLFDFIVKAERLSNGQLRKQRCMLLLPAELLHRVVAFFTITPPQINKRIESVIQQREEFLVLVQFRILSEISNAESGQDRLEMSCARSLFSKPESRGFLLLWGQLHLVERVGLLHQLFKHQSFKHFI